MYFYEKDLLLCSLKHYKRGFQQTFVFLLFKDKKKPQNENWNFWFWFLLSKNGRSVMVRCFSKIALLKPLFLQCFWVSAFGAKLSKNNISDPPQKNRRFWFIIEKLLFWYFLFFFFPFLFFFFVFCFWFCLRVR